MAVRMIDPWVNVSMGGPQPDWMIRVKEDYFRSDRDRVSEPGFAVLRTERINHRNGTGAAPPSCSRDKSAAAVSVLPTPVSVPVTKTRSGLTRTVSPR